MIDIGQWPERPAEEDDGGDAQLEFIREPTLLMCTKKSEQQTDQRTEEGTLGSGPCPWGVAHAPGATTPGEDEWRGARRVDGENVVAAKRVASSGASNRVRQVRGHSRQAAEQPPPWAWVPFAS